VLIAHLAATTSADSIVSGPLMTLVQPLDQTSSDYTFNAIRPQYSTDAEFHHFVDVITDTPAAMTLVIDSRLLTASDYFRNWTSIAQTGLSSAVLRVSTGYHRIYTLGGHAIGGKVYGLRQNEAYGFPLGSVARGRSLWTSKELNSLLWWSSPDEVVVVTDPPATTTAAINSVDYSTHRLTTIAADLYLENQTTVTNNGRIVSNTTTVDDLESLHTTSDNVSSSVQFNVTHLFTMVLTERPSNFSVAMSSSTTTVDTNLASGLSTPETIFTDAGNVTAEVTSPIHVKNRNSSQSAACCTSDTLNVTVTPELQRNTAVIVTTHDGINVTDSHSMANSTLFELLNLTVESHNESTRMQPLQMQTTVINSTHHAADWGTSHVTVSNATINNPVSWRSTASMTSFMPFLSNVSSTPSDNTAHQYTDVTSSVWPDDNITSTDFSTLQSTYSREDKIHSTHETESASRRISYFFSTLSPTTMAKERFTTTAASQPFTGESTANLFITASSDIPFNSTANVSISPAAELGSSGWSPIGIMLTGSILGTLLALVSCVLCVVLICSSFDRVTSRRVIMTMARGRKANRVGPETVFIPGLDDDGTEEAGYQSMLAAMSECSIRGVTSWSPTVSASGSRADVTSHDCMPINARRWSAKIVPLTPGYRSAGPDGMSMVELSTANIADMFNVVSASHQLPKKHHHHGKNMSTFIQSVANLHPEVVAAESEQSHSQAGEHRTGDVVDTIENCKLVDESRRRRSTDGRTFVVVNEGNVPSRTGDDQAPNQPPRNRGLRTSTWIIEDPTNRDNNENTKS
jgi:hypothetical protein